MASQAEDFGAHLREWRRRRRMTQLDLALESRISTRHLSFLETGRARPSRDMLIHLAERLDVPLRERNRLLLAAGFAPAYPHNDLGDPALGVARAAIDRLLKAHEPFPALVVDRHWNLVSANRAVAPLLAGASEPLLAPPVNVLRLSLHPQGLAPRIVNLGEWRAHLLHRLRHQWQATGDEFLAALAEELAGYPARTSTGPSPAETPPGGVLAPLRLSVPGGELSLISTTTVFGTPLDISLAEIALETFFPADAASEAWLRCAALDNS